MAVGTAWAINPARGGSKELPGKSIQPLSDPSRIAHTIAVAPSQGTELAGQPLVLDARMLEGPRWLSPAACRQNGAINMMGIRYFPVANSADVRPCMLFFRPAETRVGIDKPFGLALAERFLGGEFE